MTTPKELKDLADEMSERLAIDGQDKTDPEAVAKWLASNDLTLDAVMEFAADTTGELMKHTMEAVVANPQRGFQAALGSTLVLGFFIGIEYAERRKEEACL